jgi:hypothetical protein
MSNKQEFKLNINDASQTRIIRQGEGGAVEDITPTPAPPPLLPDPEAPGASEVQEPVKETTEVLSSEN